MSETKIQNFNSKKELYTLPHASLLTSLQLKYNNLSQNNFSFDDIRKTCLIATRIRKLPKLTNINNTQHLIQLLMRYKRMNTFDFL
jgi:hypothetical protein